MKNFKEEFPKNHRPVITELDGFFTEEAGKLFHNLADWMFEKFSLSYAIPTWSEKNGWTYKIGWSSVFLISGVTLQENGFQILSNFVCDKKSYECAVSEITELYEKEKDDFLGKIQKKNKEQAERSKLRMQREKEEKEALKGKVDPEKYNQFHWPEKLNVSRLRQLYMKDSKGLQDEELADDIGLCLYIRCKYGKEDMINLNQYKLRCHHCDKILDGSEDFRECSCGYQYSYKEYRRSYRKNNMPTGAAAKVFDDYVAKWPKLRSYEDKMMAIDTLLHEFHLNLNSGAVHRPVAMNFMDGTREKIEGIIKELAYN